jgi:hypothetical protein
MMAAKRKQPAGTGSEALRRLEKLTPAEKARTGAELLRRAQRGELTTADTEIMETITKRAAEISGIAMQPLEAQMERIAKRIAASQRVLVQDYYAAMKAAAEASADYALVLPTPDHALIGRNAELAAQNTHGEWRNGKRVAKLTHSYTPKEYLQQTSLEDEPQSRENYVQLSESLSAPARVLLSLIAGRWADETATYECGAGAGTHHPPTCRHERRDIPYTLNALARDLYGRSGGKQTAQVQRLLEELRSVRVLYGMTGNLPAGSIAPEGTAAERWEPLLRDGLKGVGMKGESRDNLRPHLTLAKGLHDEYYRGSYRRVRRELLVGMAAWEQEIALRLYAHIGTRRVGGRISRSADQQTATIRIGRTANNLMDLGAMAELLPSYADSSGALHKKLQKFAAELNSRSLPNELHIGAIAPIKKGRHTSGWGLQFYYPDLVKGRQRQPVQAAEVQQIGAGDGVAEPTQPVAAERPLRRGVLSDGSEVVYLPEEQQPLRPTCSHGVEWKLQPAGVSRGKSYAEFYKAPHKLPSGEWCKERK